jgi:hypothetical protein
LTARSASRLREFLVVAPSAPAATVTAASTVAFQVRKSLAVNSSPVSSLRYSLIASEVTSRQARPLR